MSQPQAKGDPFPTWPDVGSIAILSFWAIVLAAVGRLAGHGSDCFVAIVAGLLLSTLRSWRPR